MSLAAGLAGMEREADDIYDDGGAALGAPPASPAPPGRQQQTPYTVVSHEPVAIYADPALAGAPLAFMAASRSLFRSLASRMRSCRSSREARAKATRCALSTRAASYASKSACARWGREAGAD